MIDCFVNLVGRVDFDDDNNGGDGCDGDDGCDGGDGGVMTTIVVMIVVTKVACICVCRDEVGKGEVELHPG